jgi:hypothetical protein
MKKLLTIVAALSLGSVAVFAQGQVLMNTAQANGYVKFVYGPGTAFPNAPATNGVVSGLYYGTTAGSIDYLMGVGGIASQLYGSIAGSYGYVVGTSNGGIRPTSPNTTIAGQTLYFQIRAWSAGFANYEDALAGPAGTLVSTTTGVLGGPSGPIAQATTTATIAGTPPSIPWAPGSSTAAPSLVYLVPVPEPSTIALGALGLLGLVAIRRRK